LVSARATNKYLAASLRIPMYHSLLSWFMLIVLIVVFLVTIFEEKFLVKLKEWYYNS
jgi:hypothetical protein